MKDCLAFHHSSLKEVALCNFRRFYMGDFLIHNMLSSNVYALSMYIGFMVVMDTDRADAVAI